MGLRCLTPQRIGGADCSGKQYVRLSVTLSSVSIGIYGRWYSLQNVGVTDMPANAEGARLLRSGFVSLRIGISCASLGSSVDSLIPLKYKNFIDFLHESRDLSLRNLRVTP